MKKTLALLLAFMMIFSLFGCSKNEESDEVTTDEQAESVSEGILKLAYSKGDTLDPFNTTTTVNIQILSLVYDALYKLDKGYEPVAVIAKSSIVSGKTVNVTLSDAYFSDGTKITTNDVIYSFGLASASPVYSARLGNFINVTASASNMLVFSLAESDPYALSCLTFPIVKSGSTGELPIGSGRYIPEKSGETVYLVVNSSRAGFNPTIKTIMLVPIRDNSSVESSLEVGNTGFYYDDLSSGVYTRINAHTVEMGINHFVYLAFNSQSEIFADTTVRKAVGMAINRNEIVTTAFQGHARVTYSPFNPDWYATASKDMITEHSLEAATKLLEENNINIKGKEISLLVNADNPFKLEAGQFIKEYLTKLGFKVNLKDYAFNYYTEAVEIGSYDIYIGEVKLMPNMDISTLIAGGQASYGIDSTGECSTRYRQFLNGECEIMDFINSFNDELPLIPLCYRNAAVSYTNSMQGEFNCCDSDVFYNIEAWSFK